MRRSRNKNKQAVSEVNVNKNEPVVEPSPSHASNTSPPPIAAEQHQTMESPSTQSKCSGDPFMQHSGTVPDATDCESDSQRISTELKHT